MTLELNEMREVLGEDLGEEGYIGSSRSMCKGPQVGASLAYVRNSKRARVPTVKCASGQVVGASQVRATGGTKLFRAV